MAAAIEKNAMAPHYRQPWAIVLRIASLCTEQKRVYIILYYPEADKREKEVARRSIRVKTFITKRNTVYRVNVI